MIKRPIRSVLGIAVFLIISTIGLEEVKKQGANWMPINYVRVEGTFQHIEKKTIKHVLNGQVNNGLYNANIKTIQQSVTHLPWVQSVIIKRVWPDALNIRINEHEPIARWGTTDLINTQGELFRPTNFDNYEHLPIVSGHSGNEKKMLRILDTLTVALQDQKLKLTHFRESNRRAWYITLQDGIEIKLGRNEPFKKLQVFLKTLPLIGKEQVDKIKVVDLRYPNGYAITWKPTEEQIDWKLLANNKKDIAY